MSDHEHHHEHEHHEHGHHHDHEHHHEHGADSPEECLALLKYMLSHNAHHAEELHDLAHSTEGEARELIHEAVKDIEQSNEKLKKAVALLEK